MRKAQMSLMGMAEYMSGSWKPHTTGHSIDSTDNSGVILSMDIVTKLEI